MKVVLFCGGLGTRIREYPEPVPKPMIPVGHEPILWHVMQYYSQYGHRDFVLCMGYKADVIKRFFLDYRPHVYADCLVSGNGSKVELLGKPQEDWRVALIDTGVWRNIGQRLWAVRDHVNDEECFLANYSDGLCDVDLDDMIRTFKASGKAACFLAVHPPVTFHLADIADDGRVRALLGSDNSNVWINGGFFIMRPSIFEYMREGEELVIEPSSVSSRTTNCWPTNIPGSGVRWTRCGIGRCLRRWSSADMRLGGRGMTARQSRLYAKPRVS